MFILTNGKKKYFNFFFAIILFKIIATFVLVLFGEQKIIYILSYVLKDYKNSHALLDYKKMKIINNKK